MKYFLNKKSSCSFEPPKIHLALPMSGINWRHITSQETAQEKLKLQVLIPVDLLRINESRYLTQHLLIVQVLGKLNSNFMFQPMMT